MRPKSQPATGDSRKTFEQLARELECDEDEARFEETVRRIAPKDGAKPAPKPSE